mgnify:CR=1 FL=1
MPSFIETGSMSDQSDGSVSLRSLGVDERDEDVTLTGDVNATTRSMAADAERGDVEDVDLENYGSTRSVDKLDPCDSSCTPRDTQVSLGEIALGNRDTRLFILQIVGTTVLQLSQATTENCPTIL